MKALICDACGRGGAHPSAYHDEGEPMDLCDQCDPPVTPIGSSLNLSLNSGGLVADAFRPHS